MVLLKAATFGFCQGCRNRPDARLASLWALAIWLCIQVAL
jgi:hypothetical protein